MVHIGMSYIQLCFFLFWVDDRMSKYLAEKFAWDFVKKNPSLSLSVICPSFVIGPPTSKRLDSLSIKLFYSFLNGDYKNKPAPSSCFGCIHVKDVALAHLNAMVSTFVVCRLLCYKLGT